MYQLQISYQFFFLYLLCKPHTCPGRLKMRVWAVSLCTRQKDCHTSSGCLVATMVMTRGEAKNKTS